MFLRLNNIIIEVWNRHKGIVMCSEAKLNQIKYVPNEEIICYYRLHFAAVTPSYSFWKKPYQNAQFTQDVGQTMEVPEGKEQKELSCQSSLPIKVACLRVQSDLSNLFKHLSKQGMHRLVVNYL